MEERFLELFNLYKNDIIGLYIAIPKTYMMPMIFYKAYL